MKATEVKKRKTDRQILEVRTRGPLLGPPGPTGIQKVLPEAATVFRGRLGQDCRVVAALIGPGTTMVLAGPAGWEIPRPRWLCWPVRDGIQMRAVQAMWQDVSGGEHLVIDTEDQYRGPPVLVLANPEQGAMKKFPGQDLWSYSFTPIPLAGGE